MRGRWLVVAVVVLGVVLALVAGWFRGRRGPTLPLKPGTVLVVTLGAGELPGLGPFAADTVDFTTTHGVSSELVASLGALATGRIPRANGLVRPGDTLAADVRTFCELLQPQGFRCALFTGSVLPARASGLARGAAIVFENPAPDAATVADRAASWLLAADTAPALAWLHLDQWPDGAPAAFLDRLAPLRDRLVLAVVALGSREFPRLRLRIPGGLLARHVDPRAVSLLDLAPTLLELYGAPVPTDWMEPFLLAPRGDAARFFAYAAPLPPPDLDADQVTLTAGAITHVCDPATPPHAEIQRILREAFGWERDAAGVMRWKRATR